MAKKKQKVPAKLSLKERFGARLLILSSALDALGRTAAKVAVRIPRSLSFESMDEGEFSELFMAFARYVSERYWPDLSAQQIIDLARAMPEEET
jgi:hypothetical protein